MVTGQGGNGVDCGFQGFLRGGGQGGVTLEEKSRQEEVKGKRC